MKKLILFVLINILISQVYSQNDFPPRPCGGAAIMLDKMNVFYIGVPNPITLSVGTSWDKVKVTAKNCLLSGTSGNRVVTLSNTGNAYISIATNELTSTFNFRVKEIPNPVFKLGGTKGSGRITVAEFKKQKFCMASLENFDFNAMFSVVSANVYFSGTNFSKTETASIKGNSLSEISKYMDRCDVGSTIIFDDVKVLAPDGKQRTIHGIGIILY